MVTKAIIFDFDDTLFQTKQIKIQAIQYWAKHFYNLDYSEAHISALWGTPFTEFMTKLKGEGDAVDIAIQKYYSIMTNFITQPYPGVQSGLEQLAKHYLLGVVSSASKDLVIGDMQRAKFPGNYFSYIQGCDETSVHKPNPDVFLPILEFLKAKGILKSEIIYVGDTFDDMKAATAAGIKFIAMAEHGITTEGWESQGAISVKNLQELQTVL